MLMRATRRDVLRLGAALALPALSRRARADTWPNRPLRVVIPFSAGSTVDIIGRIAMDPLSAALGQPIVVENRGGAGGTIGAAAVAKSDPDGYTLLINASAHSAAPAIYPNLPYDTAQDFAAVAMLGVVPNVTVVAPLKGIKTLPELVAAGRSGTLSFASAGIGSATHWGAERLLLSAGIKALHIPFKGGPEALTEVMAGRVDFMSVGISSGLPLIRDGKLIPLAVSTQKRASALSDVPTSIEAGFPNSDYTFWNGLFVPAKTSREIVDRLYQDTQSALQLPQVQQKFTPQSIEPMPLAPREIDALVRREIASNIELVKAASLKFN
jgi:tripartite-type tricarboxylate transporter receptor subunit TctC